MAATRKDKPDLETESDETKAENEGMPPKTKSAKHSFRITAPVPTFKGTRCGVKFADGEGSTNDREIAVWFKSLGYAVSPDV